MKRRILDAQMSNIRGDRIPLTQYAVDESLVALSPAIRLRQRDGAIEHGFGESVEDLYK